VLLERVENEKKTFADNSKRLLEKMSERLIIIIYLTKIRDMLNFFWLPPERCS